MSQRILRYSALLSCLILLGLLFPFKTLAYTEVRDQYYLGQCCNVHTLSSDSDYPTHQIFTPALDRLTKVKIEFSTYFDDEYSYTINITDYDGSKLDSSTNSKVKCGRDSCWNTFTFSTPVELAPKEPYRIEFVQAEGTAGLGVRWNTIDGYLGGYGVMGGNNYGGVRNIHFQTFGYNSDGSADASSDEIEIDSPTSLFATDTPDDNGTSIDLEWAASDTADIDGYRIYRSSEDPYVLIPIAEVDEDKLIYQDTTVTAGEEYYYAVTAYKGNSESESSFKDSSFALDNTSSTSQQVTQEASQAVSKLRSSIPYIIGLVFLLGIVGIVVIILIRKGKKKDSGEGEPTQPEQPIQPEKPVQSVQPEQQVSPVQQGQQVPPVQPTQPAGTVNSEVVNK